MVGVQHAAEPLLPNHGAISERACRRRHDERVPKPLMVPLKVVVCDVLANRVTKTDKSDNETIKTLWQHALGRSPNDDELAQASSLLRRSEYELLSKKKAWASVAQALLLTNEFRYVD